MLFVNFICLFYLMVLINSYTISKNIANTKKIDDSVFDSINDHDYTTEYKLKYDRRHSEHRGTERRRIVDAVEEKKKKEEDNSFQHFDYDGAKIKQNIQNSQTTKKKPSFWKKLKHFMKKDKKNNGDDAGVQLKRNLAKEYYRNKNKNNYTNLKLMYSQEDKNNNRKEKTKQRKSIRRRYENNNLEESIKDSLNSKEREYSKIERFPVKRKRSFTSKEIDIRPYLDWLNVTSVSNTGLEQPSSHPLNFISKQSAFNKTKFTTRHNLQIYSNDRKTGFKNSSKTTSRPETTNVSVASTNDYTDTITNLSKIISVMSTKVAELKKMYNIDKTLCMNTTTSSLTKTTTTTTTFDTKYDKVWSNDIVPMPKTTEDAIFRGTAQIESLLEEIKMKALHTISDQDPALTDLIANTVTETTFEHDPLLNHVVVTESYPKVMRDATVTKSDFFNYNQSYSPVVLFNNAVLKKRSLNERNLNSYSLQRRSIDENNNKKCKCHKLDFKKVISKVGSKMRAGIEKTKTTIKKIAAKMKNTTKHPKPETCKTTTKCDYMKSKEKRSKNRVTTNKADERTVTEDDFLMLTLYEDMLRKAHRKNALKLITSSETPLMFRWRKDRLSKRNSEILSSLIPKENEKLYDGGMPNESLDYDIDDSLTTANRKTDEGVTTETSYTTLSDKLLFNDYVNGYKNYLNFQKEQGHQNFSNLVRYQAHKHHDVDEIGRFILNKLPQIPDRYKRKFNDESDPMEDQDVSTKSDDSWFKKHFYFFIDNGPPKKYHTSQNMTLKAPTAQVSTNVDTATEKLKAKKELFLYDENYLFTKRKCDTSRNHYERFTTRSEKFTPIQENKKSKVITRKDADTDAIEKALSNLRWKRLFKDAKKSRRSIDSKKVEKETKQYKKSTEPPKLYTQAEKLNKNVLKPNKELATTEKNTMKQSKIRKLLNKFSVQMRHRKVPEKNNTNKPKREIPIRLPRYNPLQKLKYFFKAKEAASDVADYDILNKHIDTFKAVRYDKLPSIDEMRSSIPNIVTETTTVDPEIGKLLQETGGDNLNYPSDENSTTEDSSFMIMPPSSHPSGSHKATASTDDIYGRESEVLDVKKTTEPHVNFEDNNVQNTAKFESGHTKTKIGDINTKKTKVNEAGTSQEEYDSFTTTMNQIRNEIDKVEMRINWLEKSTMAPHLNIVNRSAKKNVYVFPSAVNLNVRDQKKSTVKIEVVLPTNYLPKSKSKLYIYGLKNNSTLPKTSYDDADDFNYNRIYFCSNNTSSRAIIPNKDGTMINKPRHSRSVSKLFQATISMNNITDEAVTEVSDPTKIHDYFNDLVIWNSDVLDSDNINQANPTWMSIMKMLKTYPEYTTNNINALENELTQISSWLKDMVDKQDKFEANDTVKGKVLTATTTPKNKLERINENSKNVKTTKSHEPKSVQSVDVKTHYNIEETNHRSILRKRDNNNEKVNDYEQYQYKALNEEHRKDKAPFSGKANYEDHDIMLGSTLPTFDDSMMILANILPSKKIVKNSLRTMFHKSKTSVKSTVPLTKINTPPVQYFTTPLPMPSNEFEKFLKEHDLGVDSVTSPIMHVIPQDISDFQTRKEQVKNSYNHATKFYADTDTPKKFTTKSTARVMSKKQDPSKALLPMKYDTQIEKNLADDYKNIIEKQTREKDQFVFEMTKRNRYHKNIQSTFKDLKSNLNFFGNKHKETTKPKIKQNDRDNVPLDDIDNLDVTIISLDNTDKEIGSTDYTHATDFTTDELIYENNLVQNNNKYSDITTENLKYINSETQNHKTNENGIYNALMNDLIKSEARQNTDFKNIPNFGNIKYKLMKSMTVNDSKNNNVLTKGEPKRIVIASELTKYDILYDDHLKTITQYSTSKKLGRPFGLGHNQKRNRQYDEEREIIKMVEIFEAVENFTRPNVMLHVDLPTYFKPCPNAPETITVPTVPKSIWNDYIMKYLSGIALLEMLSKFGLIKAVGTELNVTDTVGADKDANANGVFSNGTDGEIQLRIGGDRKRRDNRSHGRRAVTDDSIKDYLEDDQLSRGALVYDAKKPCKETFKHRLKKFNFLPFFEIRKGNLTNSDVMDENKDDQQPSDTDNSVTTVIKVSMVPTQPISVMKVNNSDSFRKSRKQKKIELSDDSTLNDIDDGTTPMNKHSTQEFPRRTNLQRGHSRRNKHKHMHHVSTKRLRTSTAPLNLIAATSTNMTSTIDSHRTISSEKGITLSTKLEKQTKKIPKSKHHEKQPKNDNADVYYEGGEELIQEVYFEPFINNLITNKSDSKDMQGHDTLVLTTLKTNSKDTKTGSKAGSRENDIYYEPHLKFKSTLKPLKKKTKKHKTKLTTIGRMNTKNKSLDETELYEVKLEKRDAHENTFTAKNVAALEVVVDLMKNLDTDENEQRYPLSNGIQRAHIVPLNPITIANSSDPIVDGVSLNQTTNSIQVHIAIPYSPYDKKRSIVPLRVRKVFTAKLSTPVDLEYQIHSVEDNYAGPTTTKMRLSSPQLTAASNFSPGLYLLVGYPNTSLFNESLSLQPLLNLDFNKVHAKNSISNVTLTTPKVLATNTEKNIGKITLSKEFISALNKQILSIYENLTLKPEDHENIIGKATSSPTNLAKLRSKRHINWDAVKKYFGHERACSCRCVPNKPMCKVCAATDAVMSELIFELDNLAKYMNDHCTEIQTFFWMNPSGGRKLRESVRTIDKTLNDYFKRVKGKCQGRTCKMLSMPVDKRELGKVGKKEIVMPLMDDLVALESDLEAARDLNISFNRNIKDAGENLINTITNCVPVVSDDKHILKSRQNNRTVYSLDNISVNIICNPEMPTSEAYDKSLSYLFADIQTDKNYPFLNNHNVDELTRNKKKSKSLKSIFSRDKKKKKEKNVEAQLNISKSSLTKRELSKSGRQKEFQIESPLQIDSGSSFKHDKSSTEIIRDVRNIKNIKKIIMRNLMKDMKSNDVENTTSTHIEFTEPSTNNEKYSNEITPESDILNDDINEFLNSFTFTKVYYDTTTSEPVKTITKKLHTKINTTKSKQASRKTSYSKFSAPNLMPKKTTINKVAHKTHRIFTKITKYTTGVASTKTTSVAMNKLFSNPPNKVPSTTILNKVTSTTASVSQNSQTTFSPSTTKAKSTSKKTKFLDRLKAASGDFLEKLDDSIHINEVTDTTTFKPKKLDKTTRDDTKNTKKKATSSNKILTHLPFKSINRNPDFYDEKYVHKKSATKNISSTPQIKATETSTNDVIEINDDANLKSLLLSILRYEANVLGDEMHKVCKQEMVIQRMQHSDDQNGFDAEAQIPNTKNKNYGVLANDLGFTPQSFTSEDFFKWVTNAPQTTSKHSTSTEDIKKAHYFYYDMWKSLHDMDGSVISDKVDKVKNKKPEKGLMTKLKNGFGTDNTKKKAEKVDKEKHLRDLRDIPSRDNLSASSMQTNDRSYANILRFKTTIADGNSFPLKTAFKMEVSINEPNHIDEPSENVTNKSKVLKIAALKTNTEERSRLEAYDPHPDSHLLCDLRATIDHIRDKQRSVSPRDFERYVRNLKCYKYRNPPEYFYVEPCQETLKSRNIEYSNIFKLKIPTKTSKTNDLKWCGTRDKRFLVDGRNLKNNEEIVNDEQDSNYDEVADDDDDEQFFETESKVKNRFNTVDFVIGDDKVYFDTYLKGKDGVYRENRKKKIKRDTDLSELVVGLRNLPQLQPPLDEIYAMRGDSVKLHCFPSDSSPNDPLQFEGLLDLTRYKWNTDREDMLKHDNVAIEGPNIYIKKVTGINIGNYSCSKDNVVRRNVHLTVTSLPKFEVVFTPRYRCENRCNYEDLKALQCLGHVIADEVYSPNYQSTVRVDEPVCLRDEDDDSPQVRTTVVMGNVRHPRYKCSVQCRRDLECSLALLVAANVPALSSVKVVLASKEGNKTLTPSLNVGRRFAVTHTLRRKDSNRHREYHKLAARMVPGSVSVVVSCPAGFYLIREHKICAPCPVDTYSTAGSNACSPCAGGTHSPPAAPRCRRVPPALRMRRYEWWCDPPCGWSAAGWGAAGGGACVALALCGAARAALRGRCAAPPRPAAPQLRPTLKRSNLDRTTTGSTFERSRAPAPPPRRALSPSRVILARFFRSPPPSSRATDSQETKFELWKEKNIPPPLPPIDFDS